MNPMTIVHTFLLLIVGSLYAIAAPLDVFDPPVLSPNASTVWTVGEVVNITWYVCSFFHSHSQLDTRLIGMLRTPRNPSPTKHSSFFVTITASPLVSPKNQSHFI